MQVNDSSNQGRSKEDIARLFRAAYGQEPDFVAATPGRVNLIGEHTDYNDGWVLPMTLDAEVYVALRKRGDKVLNMVSVDFGEKTSWDLQHLETRPSRSWDSYIASVYRALQNEGYHVTGADLLVVGDIPQGAGLSSSAALELCVARAACAAGGWQWDPVPMALLGQEAESHFMGVHCGVMDQMAVAACEPGCALLIDCRKLKLESIAINLKDAIFVVVDSGVKRELKNSAYNDRREECEKAYAELQKIDPGLNCLSDATLTVLKKAGDPSEVWFRRARHVLTENARVRKAVEALKSGDAPAFGALMTQSHESLRQDFEVSSR
ncbi:MAG: galactokinase, partial [candidate division FCPU426 bacterium]